MKHIEEFLGGLVMSLVIIAIIGAIFFFSSYKISCNSKFVDNSDLGKSYSMLVCVWAEK